MSNNRSWAYYHAFNSSPERKSRLICQLRYWMDCLDIHPRRSFRLFLQLANISNHSRTIPVFLHIPKTGGTYVSHCFSDIEIISLNHSLIRETLTDSYIPIGLVGTRWSPSSNHIMFATVRDPVTFFRSYYHHVIGHGNYHNTNHYDFNNASKGFEYLLKSIMNRTDVWPSRKFLYPQLFNESGHLIAHWINKLELIDNDLNEFSEKYGLVFNPGVKKRNAPVQNLEHYYTDTLLDELASIYDRECRIFGYGKYSSGPNPTLHKDTRAANIKYFYLDDKLFLDESVSII